MTKDEASGADSRTTWRGARKVRKKKKKKNKTERTRGGVIGKGIVDAATCTISQRATQTARKHALLVPKVSDGL